MIRGLPFCVMFALLLSVLSSPALAGATGGSNAALAAPKPAPAARARPGAAPVASGGATGVNAVTLALVQAGVLSCATRVNQLVNFLAPGKSRQGAIIFPPTAQPDRRLASFSMAVRAGNGQLAYVTGSIAPNQANGCGAEYETVSYWAGTCRDLAATQLKGARVWGPFGRDMVMLMAGTARFFLMPAGSGCVAIKKEVLE